MVRFSQVSLLPVCTLQSLLVPQLDVCSRSSRPAGQPRSSDSSRCLKFHEQQEATHDACTLLAPGGVVLGSCGPVADGKGCVGWQGPCGDSSRESDHAVARCGPADADVGSTLTPSKTRPLCSPFTPGSSSLQPQQVLSHSQQQLARQQRAAAAAPALAGPSVRQAGSATSCPPSICPPPSACRPLI